MKMSVMGKFFSHILLSICVQTLIAEDTNGPDRHAQECGGRLQKPSGMIASPGYPEYYPSKSHCRWVIEAPGLSTITVISNVFAVEESSDPGCRWDYLEIRDGSDVTHGPGLRRFCGNKPVSYTSSSNVLYLYFVSDASYQLAGFELHYRVNGGGPRFFSDSDPPENCNVTYDDPDPGFLTSPGYPILYPPNVDCYYRFEAPVNNRVQIQFEQIDLEEAPCEYDYVKIFDGNSLDSAVLGTFCGHDIPQNVTSSRRYLVMQFRSDRDRSGSGFNVSYTFERISVCGAVLTKPSGVITSPSYPDVYPPNSHCSTTIRTPRKHVTSLEIINFDLERGTSECYFDYVVISGFSKGITAEIKLCGNDITKKIYESEGTDMVLTFVSDASIEKRGYNATYNVVPVCNIKCRNGGKCRTMTVDGEHSDRCECPVMFAGDRCQYLNPCHRDPCLNGGYCTVGKTGNFVCRCTNGYQGVLCGQERTNPIISGISSHTAKQGNVTIGTGESVAFDCSSTDHVDRFTWLFKSTSIAPERILLPSDTANGYHRHDNGLLEIKSADIKHRGRYTCIASGNSGFLIPKSYQLEVIDNAQCDLDFSSVPPNEMVVVEGSKLLVDCHPRRPDVTLSWSRSGEQFGRTGRIFILRGGQLSISSISIRDSGRYTCEIRDFAHCKNTTFTDIVVRRGQRESQVCGRPVPSPAVAGVRISSGNEGRIEEFPWHVTLKDRFGKVYCGGAIIADSWIVTAAHCVHKSYVEKLHKDFRVEEDLIVISGTHSCNGDGLETESGVSTHIIHPDFNLDTNDNDIALLKLRRPFVYGREVLPICLNGPIPHMINPVIPGRMGNVSGCGAVNHARNPPNKMYYVTVPVVDPVLCNITASLLKFTENMLCAGYSEQNKGDACEGDSGSPFVIRDTGRYYLVGLVSWGDGCDEEGMYGYYTRVSLYYEWIRKIVGGELD